MKILMVGDGEALTDYQKAVMKTALVMHVDPGGGNRFTVAGFTEADSVYVEQITSGVLCKSFDRLLDSRRAKNIVQDCDVVIACPYRTRNHLIRSTVWSIVRIAKQRSMQCRIVYPTPQGSPAV